MKNKLQTTAETLLILLFVYAAASKLIDFNHFRGELYNQTFPHAWAGILLYLLPATELAAAALIIYPKTTTCGLALSLWLLIVFTGYIVLVQAHFWSRVPCSCGGILSHLSWTVHLYFNLFFILVNGIALIPATKGKAENLEQSRHYRST
jgi:putative oxidoreductase